MSSIILKGLNVSLAVLLVWTTRGKRTQQFLDELAKSGLSKSPTSTSIPMLASTTIAEIQTATTQGFGAILLTIKKDGRTAVFQTVQSSLKVKRVLILSWKCVQFKAKCDCQNCNYNCRLRVHRRNLVSHAYFVSPALFS